MRISYLSVDAHLENDKTVINFYTDINDLEKVLRAEGHTVKVMYKEIDTIADVAIENVDKNYQMAKITEVITKICEYLDKDNLFGVQLLVQKSDGLQRVITNHIINLGEYIDPNNLLHHIEKRSAERDSRG